MKHKTISAENHKLCMEQAYLPVLLVMQNISEWALLLNASCSFMMNYAGSSNTTMLRCWSSCTGGLESHWISGRQKYYLFSFFLLLRSSILWRVTATNTKMNMLKMSDKIIVFSTSSHFFFLLTYLPSPHIPSLSDAATESFEIQIAGMH